MQAEWFSNPEYLQVDGRPLLLDFGPMHVRDPAVWTDAFEVLPVRPAFFGLHHLWKHAGADGGFTWVHHDPWEGTPTQERILERIGEVFTYFSNDPDEVIVSAYPGFKDVYENPHPVLDHRGGKTLRETLAVAMAGPWPLIQLVTWNDYGEGTMIEPTHEFDYTFLEIIQQARRDERGDTFPYTAGDLRLPARLYALRKRDDFKVAAADRIARLLRDGACRDAREELDAQESNPGRDDSGGLLGERGPRCTTRGRRSPHLHLIACLKAESKRPVTKRMTPVVRYVNIYYLSWMRKKAVLLVGKFVAERNPVSITRSEESSYNSHIPNSRLVRYSTQYSNPENPGQAMTIAAVETDTRCGRRMRYQPHFTRDVVVGDMVALAKDAAHFAKCDGPRRVGHDYITGFGESAAARNRGTRRTDQADRLMKCINLVLLISCAAKSKEA